MVNWKPEIQEAIKIIRRAIKDETDQSCLYGLEEELSDLAAQALFKFIDFFPDD